MKTYNYEFKSKSDFLKNFQTQRQSYRPAQRPASFIELPRTAVRMKKQKCMWTRQAIHRERERQREKERERKRKRKRERAGDVQVSLSHRELQ